MNAELGIRLDLEKNSLAIKSENFYEPYFEFKTNDYKWDYRKRKMAWVPGIYKIYTYRKSTDEYLIPIGMLMYYTNVMSDLSEDIKNWCNAHLYSSLEAPIQDCLYDEQYLDMLELIKYKRGVMQSYTGSGKTQLIGVLIKNLLLNDGNILVAGPKNMVLDEIKDRLKKFGVYEPCYFDESQRVNCLNPNGICNSNIYKDGGLDKWLSDVKFVIVDEVDKLSDTSFELLNRVETSGCDTFWGFSATAKKNDAEEIPCSIHLMDVMNYDLLSVVSKFSHSVIYKIPTDFVIDINEVKMGLPERDYLRDPDIGTDSYKHTFGYCTTNSFINYLRYLMTKCKPLIPIYYTTIIQFWVDQFPDKRLIVLCGSGYQLWENGEIKDYLDINTLKYLVSVGDFDAIMTTTSGFAALDCPELTDVVLLSGTSAGSVIQYIGRVARTKKFSIWYSSYDYKIPIITRNHESQLTLINRYYRLCHITRREINYGD